MFHEICLMYKRYKVLWKTQNNWSKTNSDPFQRWKMQQDQISERALIEGWVQCAGNFPQKTAIFNFKMCIVQTYGCQIFDDKNCQMFQCSSWPQQSICPKIPKSFQSSLGIVTLCKKARSPVSSYRTSQNSSYIVYRQQQQGEQ